jgi:hypothetical protein
MAVSHPLNGISSPSSMDRPSVAPGPPTPKKLLQSIPDSYLQIIGNCMTGLRPQYGGGSAAAVGL